MVRHGEEEVETMGLFKKSAIGSKPKLSIVVIFHNMTREAERTLYSLSPAYQEDVTADDYEIIAIDNGSNQPINPELTKAFGMNCVYQYLKTDSPSPAAAINLGVRTARGEYMALIVDGARMVTPGIISETLRALEVFKDPFVCTLGWHLGPDVQNVSMLEGYDQLVEDELLNSIEWLKNGYKLFEISTLAQSSHVGLLGGMPDECSWFAMRRDGFFELGGYEEQFQSPGGGLINHYFLNRVIRHEDIQPVVLLGEGSFHQIHGGVATNVPVEQHPIEEFKEEYEAIIGLPYAPVMPANPVYYMGTIHPLARRFINTNSESNS